MWMNLSILDALVLTAFEIDQHDFVRHIEFLEHDERPDCPGLRCVIELHRGALFLKVLNEPYTAEKRLYSNTSAVVCRATIRFSLVGMTRTRQRLSTVVIVSSLAALRRESIASPRYSGPSQTSARTGAGCSPIPPVKMSRSNPPSAAANAPTDFLTW